MKLDYSFKKYFPNSFWMLLEQALRLLAGFFIGAYIARYLGPAQFGFLNYILAIVTFFIVVSRMGMDAVLVRDLSRDPEKANSLLTGALILMIVASLSCCAILFLLSIFVLNNELSSYLFFIFIALICSPASFIEYYFQSQSRTKYSAICKTAALMISSIVKILLVLLEADLFWIVSSFFLDYFLIAIFLFIALYRFNGDVKNIAFHFSYKTVFTLLKSAWPMVITNVAILIYMRIDVVMIKELMTPEAAGVYSAAVKIYEAWIVIPMTLSISLIPAIVRFKCGGDAVYEQKMKELFSLAVWGSVVLALAFLFVSESLVLLVFGSAYSESSSILNILMFASIFAAMGSITARYLSVENMERKILVRTLFTAGLNILLNLVLIPIYGIKGAALSTLFCMACSGYVLDYFDKDLRHLLVIKNHAIFLGWKTNWWRV